jgi:hypothetical protein
MVALTQQLLDQFCDTSFNKAMSNPSVVGSDVSSGLPPSKRARVMKTLKFGEVDLGKVTLNAYKLATGKMSYTPVLDEMRLRFDLTPQGALVRSNWGFETRYKLNPEKKPSFLGGPSTSKMECLEMNVELTSEQAAFITSLDLVVSREFAKNSKATWHPAVKFTDSSIPMLKVRVPITGNDPATLKVVDEGIFHKGEGWKFLAPWMAKTRDFGPSKAKVTLVASRVWEMGGRAGIIFQAVEMTLMSVAKPRPEFESAQDDEEEMMADFNNDDL